MKRICIAALRGTGRFCLGMATLAARTTLVLAVLAAISVGALLAPQYMPVSPAYAQWAQGVLYAISSLTGEREPIKSTDGALWAFGQLLECEDEAAQLCRVRDGADEYEVVTTTATDVRLGATGADGDYLGGIRIDAASGTCDVKDGSTEIFDIDASAASNSEIFVGLVATASTGWAINCSGGTPRVIARGIFDTP